MIVFRESRTLVRLMQTASSARVFNLAVRTAAQRRATPKPRRLFLHPALDRAIVVKHRLRLHEFENFHAPRSVATKLLLPIDPKDVGLGAHSVMVGERVFEAQMAEHLGVSNATEAGRRDLAVLAALDALPSFDPFLAREHLRRFGFEVQKDYFDISPADVGRMLSFVRRDIVPLVRLCFGEEGDPGKADRLTRKLLASDLDAGMDPLRQTLRMAPDEFEEGVFCWKGFLYYKWSLAEVLAGAAGVTEAIGHARFVGRAEPEELMFIGAARLRIQQRIKRACVQVKRRLDAYDNAFAALTERADPVAFRDFLLAAPTLFLEVGDLLGALQHIASFWAYSFGRQTPGVTAAELLDIFREYETSLGGIRLEAGPRPGVLEEAA